MQQDAKVSEKIFIVGIADDGLVGLSNRARAITDKADVIIGPASSLELVESLAAEKIAIAGDLQPAIERINNRQSESIVILTQGDPLFYGTARFLFERFGKDQFEIVPHVSLMQLAFARLKESWDDAYFANVATHQLHQIVERIRSAEKVGLFTSEEITPKAIAAHLIKGRIEYFSAYVCENLGSPEERVTQGTLAEIADQEFSPLNVMVLIRHDGHPDQVVKFSGHRTFGNADELFLQSQPKRGLLTPAEVRSLALAELALTADSIVWDVGAGSGSVAIEAAQLAHRGSVFAIEMDPEDHRLLTENVERFATHNVVPVLGEAPAAWSELPDPDAIFVGGSGRMVPTIVEEAFRRLKIEGRIVVNVVSIENLATVKETLDRIAGDSQVWMLNFARATKQLEQLRFEAMNPNYLLAATRSA